jgi:hypothetical protein
MPLILGSATIPVVSQTAEVAALDLVRERGALIRMDAVTQTAPAITGRDRSPLITTAFSLLKITINKYERHRHGIAEINPETETTVVPWVFSPSVPAPKVELFVDDLVPIESSTIKKGASFNLTYILTGYRLGYLFAEFEILTLGNTPVISKKVELMPGGISEDDITILANGEEQIIGTVFILPSETARIPGEECKFNFRVGNKSTRKYQPICGYLRFDCDG